ncbi:squalene--hopene cyclase [Aeoliella sp.]|uniref:squalene--hopene cyclase n=1 Tax=Aeoliella sp. TaxID=2795800 RepID=UPI003CCBAD00
MKALRRDATLVLGLIALAFALGDRPTMAQSPELRFGEVVPRDVREMYDRGLKYLATTQSENGSWEGGQSGPGVTGLCVMAFLASGEDPNFGVYSNPIRKGLRNIIQQQDASTGYLGNSMYHHGFAMLALAEAYGAVDEQNLWPRGETRGKRSIGEALELAVRSAVTSQKKNPLGAWRYSPDTTDADTSVSGAVLVGLLAARNAGIEVPDESIDRAIAYFKSMTSDNGQVAYSGGLGGFDESIARISIGSLVYAVARRKDLPQYETTLAYLKQRIENDSAGHYAEYTRYYQAQALFQGDIESWEKWNKLLVRQLKASQAADGSFEGQFGKPVATSMSLLSLALNYRFLPIYER